MKLEWKWAWITILLGCAVLQAQVNITSRTFAYTNTFNTLASSGTPTWTDNSTMTGWYAGRNNGGVNTPYTAYTPGIGSATNGGLYSFGSAGNADRALGSIADTVGNTAYGIRLRNTSGTTLTNFTLTFTGEQWRRAGGGGTSNQTLTVSYRISASAITSPDPANTAAWTTIAASTFNTPQDSLTGTGASLNGNTAANRVANLFSDQINISLPNNSELFIRWFDTNDGSSDHGVSIDDVRIYVPETGTLCPLTAIGLAIACRARRRFRCGKGKPGVIGDVPLAAGAPVGARPPLEVR